MRNLLRSAPVVLTAALLLVITLPAAATTVDGTPGGWMYGLLTWLLAWDLPGIVTGEVSAPGEPEEPPVADGTDSSDTLTSPQPEEGSDTEAAPYVDPNG